MAHNRILDSVRGVVDFEALTELVELRDPFLQTPFLRAQGEIAGELVCKFEGDASALTAVIMARFAIADLVTCMGAERARQLTEKFLAEQRHANPVLRGPVQAITAP